jgi:hypothetical protein
MKRVEMMMKKTNKYSSLNLIRDDRERMDAIKPYITELRLIDLHRHYTVFKERYFGNTIPSTQHVAIVLIAEETMEELYGPAWELGECIGFCAHNLKLKFNEGVDAPAIICLSRKLSSSITMLTLLHEMAHLKVERKWKRDMGHGKHWQNEMKRLAKLGAFDSYW